MVPCGRGLRGGDLRAFEILLLRKFEETLLRVRVVPTYGVSVVVFIVEVIAVAMLEDVSRGLRERL